MTRRELREQIFKLLFGVEFHDRQELPEQIAVYEETEEPWDTKDGAYISGKCEDIVAHLAEIDEAIDAVAEGWKTGLCPWKAAWNNVFPTQKGRW